MRYSFGRFSKTALTVLVLIAGCFTVHYCLTAPTGDIVGGWSLNWRSSAICGNCSIDVSILRRTAVVSDWDGWFTLKKRAFWWCSLMIVVTWSFPRLGGENHFWMNGLYEACCILFVFPVIVSMGAGGKITGKRSTKMCKFWEIFHIRYIQRTIH